MSGFNLAQMPSAYALMRPPDCATRNEMDREYSYGPGAVVARPFEDARLWPNSRMCGGDLSDGVLSGDSCTSGRWGVPQTDDGGGAQMKKIIGQTLDSGGSPMPGAQIQGYTTAADMFVNQATVSDGGGYYEFCTQFNEAHYLVAYKAGSPDIAGTTVNIPV